MILNCNVLHRIEAEKTPSMEPNEPTSLRNTARNSKLGDVDFWQTDPIPFQVHLVNTLVHRRVQITLEFTV